MSNGTITYTGHHHSTHQDRTFEIRKPEFLPNGVIRGWWSLSRVEIRNGAMKRIKTGGIIASYGWVNH